MRSAAALRRAACTLLAVAALCQGTAFGEADPAPEPLGARLERLYRQVLHQALRLRPDSAAPGWELVTIASGAFAPFVSPEGKIVIALQWARTRALTDAEIAFVLAHEMAHLIAGHASERIAALAAAGLPGLETLIRAQELEADRIGLAIACSAGFAAADALSLFDKMATYEGYGLSPHGHALVRKARLLALPGFP